MGLSHFDRGTVYGCGYERGDFRQLRRESDSLLFDDFAWHRSPNGSNVRPVRMIALAATPLLTACGSTATTK